MARCLRLRGHGNRQQRRRLSSGRTAACDGRDRGQHRQRQHARFQGRAHAVQRLAQPTGRHRRAARRPQHRVYAGPRDMARTARGHADAYQQSVRSRHHQRRILHCQNIARAAPDARWPLRPDARRQRWPTAPATRCWTPTDSPSCCRLPIRRSPSLATAPSPARTASSPKWAWCNQPTRCSSRLRATRCSGSGSTTAPVTSPGLVQGSIEDSNVQPVLEMTRMIDGERQFQFMTQFIQAESDREQSAIDKLLTPAAEAKEIPTCVRSISPAPGCRRSRPTLRSSPTISPT